MAFLELLTKGMGVINHHIKYFKNHSFYEEGEVMIIYICSMKAAQHVKLDLMQLKDYGIILP